MSSSLYLIYSTINIIIIILMTSDTPGVPLEVGHIRLCEHSLGSVASLPEPS